MSPPPTPGIDDLRARLDASRAALLAALEGLTDREFAAEVEPGATVIEALARLAPAERDAIDRARAAAGAPPRPRPLAAGPLLTRAVPPQVVHDLAGARHETLTFLDTLNAIALDATSEDGEPVHAILAAIAAREETAAATLAAIPRGGPAPASGLGLSGT